MRRPSKTSRRLLSAIVDVPDPALLAIANVQRSIGSLRHSIGAECGVGRVHQWRLAGETGREDFEVAGRLATRERLEGHVVAILRHGCAIPRSVKGDEYAALILLRELLAAIEGEIHGRPVGREGNDRGRE